MDIVDEGREILICLLPRDVKLPCSRALNRAIDEIEMLRDQNNALREGRADPLIKLNTIAMNGAADEIEKQKAEIKNLSDELARLRAEIEEMRYMLDDWDDDRDHE